MGKSMYNYGNQIRENARQQKQMDKASKRLMAKRSKIDIRSNTAKEDTNIAEPSRVKDIVNGTV